MRFTKLKQVTTSVALSMALSSSPAFFNSSIGHHVRHVLEMFIEYCSSVNWFKESSSCLKTLFADFCKVIPRNLIFISFTCFFFQFHTHRRNNPGNKIEISNNQRSIKYGSFIQSGFFQWNRFIIAFKIIRV